MSQALYRKWRPQTWEAVIGQDHVIGTLRNALSAGRIAHAYLFAGPRGTGKTTTARLLAKAVNCLEEKHPVRPCGECDHCKAVVGGRFLDLIEIDAASNTSVDDVRDLRDKINFSPNLGRYKVYIIDEVHMLSTAAFNALLKTLEEPPPHAIFVLATTEVHKIPATVLSRCQRHEFRRIPVLDIVAHLKMLVESESIQAAPEVLTLIARQSTGAMRDAISLLDQLASTGQAITIEAAQDILGTATSQAVVEVVESLRVQKADAGLDIIHSTLDAGSDPRQFARQIVDYLREMLLVKTNNANLIETTSEMRSQIEQHAQVFNTADLLRIIRVFNAASSEARNSWQPFLPLEMAYLEALQNPINSQATKSKDEPPGSTSQGNPKITARSQSPPAPAGEDHEGRQISELSSQDRKATQTLSETWQKLLGLVRRNNPKAYGLLNSTKSRFIHGDMLILNFASDLLKNQMEKDDNLDATQDALYQIFQRDILVRCNVDTTKRDAIPAGVDNDGMIAAVLRDLGGEIVDIQ